MPRLLMPAYPFLVVSFFVLTCVTSFSLAQAPKNCISQVSEVFDTWKLEPDTTLFDELQLQALMGHSIELVVRPILQSTEAIASTSKQISYSGILVHNGLPKMVSSTYPETRLALLQSDGTLAEPILAKDKYKIESFKSKESPTVNFQNWNNNQSRYQNWKNYSSEIWTLPMESHLQTKINQWSKEQKTVAIQLWAPFGPYTIMEGTLEPLGALFSIQVMTREVPRSISLKLENGKIQAVPLALIRDFRVKP